MIEKSTPDHAIKYIKKTVFPFSCCSNTKERKKVSRLLLTEDGEIKLFPAFYKDVKALFPDCNKNALLGEYMFATSAADTFERWKQYQKDGDRYNIQYRDTDSPLHDITLSIKDEFWRYFLPPNKLFDYGIVIQVLKKDYPLSDSKEAFRIASETIAPEFRFNVTLDKIPEEL